MSTVALSPDAIPPNQAAPAPPMQSHKGRKAKTPPWKQWPNVLWLLAALAFSVWIVSLMPGKPAPLADRLLARADQLADLYLMVGLAAFVGGVMEQRRWHLLLSRGMGALARFAHLPKIVGLAMPTALVSNPAANSLLVSSHEDGDLNRSALVCGGMINSYLAYVSHSLRVLYPVVGAVGLAGLAYFGIQFMSGLAVVLGVMLWHRLHSPEAPDAEPDVKEQASPLPAWSSVCKLATQRAATLLFRMGCVTLPMMLGMEWLIKTGAFNFWDTLLPEQVARFFSPEVVSVMLAQFGGLIQSATVAANFRDQGLLGPAQIVLAMLAGSALGNPFRALRRNLPTALGIFPPGVALFIVVGMQLSRLLTSLFFIMLIILVFHP